MSNECYIRNMSVLQSCLTVCDPMDCSPPDSPVHGILQARILEWVATPSCRGSSGPKDQTCLSYVSCTGRPVFATPPGTLSIRNTKRYKRTIKNVFSHADSKFLKMHIIFL